VWERLKRGPREYSDPMETAPTAKLESQRRPAQTAKAAPNKPLGQRAIPVDQQDLNELSWPVVWPEDRLVLFQTKSICVKCGRRSSRLDDLSRCPSCARLYDTEVAEVRLRSVPPAVQASLYEAWAIGGKRVDVLGPMARSGAPGVAWDTRLLWAAVSAGERIWKRQIRTRKRNRRR